MDFCILFCCSLLLLCFSSRLPCALANEFPYRVTRFILEYRVSIKRTGEYKQQKDEIFIYFSWLFSASFICDVIALSGWITKENFLYFDIFSLFLRLPTSPPPNVGVYTKYFDFVFLKILNCTLRVPSGGREGGEWVVALGLVGDKDENVFSVHESLWCETRPRYKKSFSFAALLSRQASKKARPEWSFFFFLMECGCLIMHGEAQEGRWERRISSAFRKILEITTRWRHFRSSRRVGNELSRKSQEKGTTNWVKGGDWRVFEGLITMDSWGGKFEVSDWRNFQWLREDGARWVWNLICR